MASMVGGVALVTTGKIHFSPKADDSQGKIVPILVDGLVINEGIPPGDVLLLPAEHGEKIVVGNGKTLGPEGSVMLPEQTLSMDCNADESVLAKSIISSGYYKTSVEFYDDGEPNKGVLVGVYNKDHQVGYVIGIRDSVANGQYMVQSYVSGGKQLATGILRQEGWHKVDFLVTPEGTVGFLDGVNFKYIPQTEKNTSSKYQSGINTRLGQMEELWLGCAWKQTVGEAKFRNITISPLSTPDQNLLVRSRRLVAQYYESLRRQLLVLGETGSVSEEMWNRLYEKVKNDNYNGTSINWSAGRMASELLPVAAYLYRTESDLVLKEKYLNDARQTLSWIVDPENTAKNGFQNLQTKDYERVNVGIGSWMIQSESAQDQAAVKSVIVSRANNLFNSPVGNVFLKRSMAGSNANGAAVLALAYQRYKDEPMALAWLRKSQCLAYHALSVSDDPVDNYKFENPTEGTGREIPGCGVKTKTLFDGDSRDGDPNTYLDNTNPKVVPKKFWLSTHIALPAVHYMYGGVIDELSRSGLVFLRFEPNGIPSAVPKAYRHHVNDVFNAVRNMVNLNTDSYDGTKIGITKPGSVIADDRGGNWVDENSFLLAGHDDYGQGPYSAATAFVYPSITNLSNNFSEYETLTRKLWYLAPDFIVLPQNQGILPIYSTNQPWLNKPIHRAMLNFVALNRLTMSTMMIDQGFGFNQ